MVGKKQEKAKQKSTISKSVDSVLNLKNKKLVGEALNKSKKVKSTDNIGAWNSKTGKFVYGNQRKVSQQIKSTPATIKSRFSGGKKEYENIKDWKVINFKDAEEVITFKQKLVKDIISKKQKQESIVEGMGLIEAQEDNYIISNAGSIKNKYWGTNEDRYSLNIKNNLSMNDIESVFDNAIKQTIKEQKLTNKDRIRVIIEDPNLKFFVSTSLSSPNDLKGEDIIELISEVVESNQDWQISSSTIISITSINIPQGGSSLYNGWKGGSSQSEEFLCKEVANETTELKKKAQELLKFNKKTIIKINNPNDNLCCARAIATGIFREKYGTQSTKYKQMLNNTKNIQYDTAVKLHNQSGVEQDICGLEEIKIFEEFTKYQITIIDGDFFNEVVYPDIKSKEYKPPEDDTKTIYLYKSNNHYDLIANNRVAGFFSKDNFCHKCKKCYKKKGNHKCQFKCNMCCHTGCEVINIPLQERTYDIECKLCNRLFCLESCYNNHLEVNEKGESLCGLFWKCLECDKLLLRKTFPPETHKCGDYECGNCKKIVGENHKCYMFPKQMKPPNEKYIFFDFEADISETTHKVMYSVSQKFDNPEPIIHNTIEEFCEWAFSKENKGYTFLAHNGRGYDYKFIIRWLFDNTLYKPFTIFAGQKIMCMCVKELRIRFIDSLSFLTMPLKAFPKTFDIKELKKGYFPHWFNTKENWDYIGCMPPIESFRHNSFKEKDRNDFLTWYNEKVKEDYVWNQKKEMREYCISDVDILRRCCIKFRALYLEVCNIDPFQYLTIASVCMAIYKFNFIDKTYPERYWKFWNKWEHTGLHLGGDPSKKDPQYLKDKTEFNNHTYKNVFREKKIAIFTFKEAEWFRQAFFGGRTNAMKLLYHFKKEECGAYIDITSLYPAVNFYDLYPKGHYIKLLEFKEEDYIKVKNGEYFGFIDCQIKPPKNLYHPVLPHKGEKLIFDLLEKRGVWCSNEIKKACDLGYEIIEIYEIRYFKEQTKNLFKDYVKWFLKIKQQSSGFPDWVKTTADKEEYIRQYKTRQQVSLEIDKIEKNSGLRAISKLCLNSLWGKFGQRTNMSKTEIIDNKASFLEIVLNSKYDNVNWIELNNNKMEISYSIKEAFVENDFNTNIAIACFTTSSARMRLYEALEVLQEQVLYFDTDSVVYKYNPNNPECNKTFEVGDLLGEWTDELEGKKMVGTFVSGGPKNYSYETNDKNYHTKVKGFNLNYEVGLSINHLSMIELVDKTLRDKINIKETKINLKQEIKENEDFIDTSYLQEELNDLDYRNKIEVQYNMIKRTKEHTCENYQQMKKYGLVYTKREILEPDEFGNFDTIPFGYSV